MIPNYVSIKLAEGAYFSVDFARKVLRDWTNPDNTIPLSEMKVQDSYYTFFYDRTKRNIGTCEHPDGGDTDDVYQCRLRNLTAMDPDAMAFVYGVELNEVKGFTDKEFFSRLPDIRDRQLKIVSREHDAGLISDRLIGKLPEFKIDNDTFLVDGRFGVIIDKLHPHKMMQLSSFEPAEDNQGYQGFYRFGDREFNPRGLSDQDRFEVSLVIIPPVYTLDPIGAAQAMGFGELDLLYKNPIQKNISAKVCPLSTDLLLNLVKQDQAQNRKKSRSIKH